MFFVNISYAQRYEIGLFAGGNNIVGDVGSGYYVHPNSLSIGGVFKWNLDNRWGLRFDGGVSNARGDGSVQFGISEGSGTDYEYSVALYHAEVLVEWNVFDYNLRKSRYNQTPYMTAGIGVINHDVYPDDASRKTTVSIPFGVGYKYAITQKLVLAADLMFRYSFTDDLDLTNSKKVGNLNSNDWFTTIGLTLTYVFGRDPCACDQ
ncbi:MAG: hypothetical protein KAG37_01645 [Flavobacteriales bacterium]|nr:hypothetical protein [Flavobacteriales bacterium]